MEWVKELLNHFTEAFRWFYILQPWEQAIRVRLGRWIVKHEGGLHFKIPYIDYIFMQNCRLRISDIPNQSVTTDDDQTITFAGALRYRVADVEPLYTKLHMAEDTIATYVQGVLSEQIANSVFEDCTADKVLRYVNEEIRPQLSAWGLTEFEFLLTDFAKVRTYRMITGDMNRWREHALQTDKAEI